VEHEVTIALRAPLPIDAFEIGATRQPTPLWAPPFARAPSH
jgi:hypothetical protein